MSDPNGAWMFRLWLELLAHAGRSEEMQALAARFWSGNRALMTQLVERAYAQRGETPPVPADRIASAFIAMDIGLALQHYVDPGAVPLDVYPDVWEAVQARRHGGGNCKSQLMSGTTQELHRIAEGGCPAPLALRTRTEGPS